MRRLHLFEFEDLSWFPTRFRLYLTDILRMHVEKVYIPVAPIISEMIRSYDCKSIKDLCSGSGGPWPSLYDEVIKHVAAPVMLELTDKYPQISSLHAFSRTSKPNVVYNPKCIDARQFPIENTTIYTLFTGLHHMKPHEVLQVLKHASENHKPIAIFEFTDRKSINLLWMVLSTFSLFIITPFIEPLRWDRLLFTYLIPIIPITYLWDGCVSHLRSYSQEELRSIVRKIQLDDYVYEINSLRGDSNTEITYLLGKPQ